MLSWKISKPAKSANYNLSPESPAISAMEEHCIQKIIS